MAAWDLASVIVAIIALVVAINPQIWVLCTRLYRKFLTWKDPDKGTCQQLYWDDIRNNLHNHFWPGGQGPCRQCTSALWRHANVKLCSQKTLMLVFNNLNSRKGPIKKPEQLPLAVSFVQTEPRVLLAYLIATVRCNNFELSSYLQIQKQDNLIVCHLELPNRILDLTKNEIERMLDGWPPFYREFFTSPEGHALRSPMTRYEHLKRPGWIMAVGMGLIQPADICLDPAPFKLPCDRVGTILRETFLVAWPNDADVLNAINSVHEIQDKGSTRYPSGYERETITSPYTVQYPSTTVHLSQEQCEVAMQVLNTMSISGSQKPVMEPNLKEILRRLLFGFAAVLDYSTRSCKRELIIPEPLRGEKVIYVRDCYVDGDI
ncbi:hypothetical protein MMC13_000883 [Lambiella insularis]|nr:hypothetical protein [Lambiella insularis]